jgi:integrase
MRGPSHFKNHRLSQITTEEVDRYRTAKVREGILSPNSINKTLTRLSQVLEVAVEYGYLGKNPARGKRRRLKPQAPRRASMGANQVIALLAAAGKNRALLATAIMAGGLRVSEVVAVRWRDVNLTAGTLRIRKAKTDAGVRVVELDAWLRDELAAHKAASRFTDPDDYVFPGRHRWRVNGSVWDGKKRRDRNAVRNRVLYPAIEAANVALRERGLPTIPDGANGEARVTFHSLRRTYASLCAEAGVDVAWTAEQIGHVDPRLTIAVYTDVRNRREPR